MRAALGVLRQPKSVLVGRGMRDALVSVLPAGVTRATFVTDERMAAEPAFLDLVEQVHASGVETATIASARPECPVQDVTEAARSLEQTPDVIIAVGGGSVIDFAKVLGLLLSHGGTPADYYGELRVPGPTIPVVALPTTAGTGSEATPVAVVSDASREMKVGISSPHLIPAAAICDSELTASAPRALTAASGADALSHCVESFTAVRRESSAALVGEQVFIGKSDLVDLYALNGVRAVGRSLRVAATSDGDGRTLDEARDDMSFAALAGGIALGTGGTAAAHALQYPIGALTNTAHGVGVAVLLPYVMAFNRSARLDELRQIAIALSVVDDGDPTGMSYLAIDAVCELFNDIGIPRTLADLGVTPDKHQWIAEQALTARRLVDNNPRELTIQALKDIVEAAQQGDLSRLDHPAT